MMISFLFFASVFAHAETRLKFTKPDDKPIPKILSDRRENLEKQQRDADKKLKKMDPSLKGINLTVAWIDLNDDKIEDLCASFASFALFGNTGGSLFCYVGKGSGDFTEVISGVIAAPEVVVLPGSRTNGYLDLSFGGPGITPPRVLKWNGRGYF